MTTHDQSMRSTARSFASSTLCIRSQPPSVASRAVRASSSCLSRSLFPAETSPKEYRTTARTGCRSERRDRRPACAPGIASGVVSVVAAAAGSVITVRHRVWVCHGLLVRETKKRLTEHAAGYQSPQLILLEHLIRNPFPAEAFLEQHINYRAILFNIPMACL